MNRHSILSLIVLAYTTAVSSLLAAQEQAQIQMQSSSGEASENTSTPTPHQTLTHDESGSGWTFTLGAVGLNQPRYPGSNDQQIEAVPFLKIDYKGLVGLQGDSIYLRPFQTGPWSMGLLGTMEISARKESDSRAFAGMGDRKSGVFGGIELAYRTEPISAVLEVMKGANKAGLVASMNLSHTQRFNERWGLELGLTGVWGDKDNNAWDFGITPIQAARRQALIEAGDKELRPIDARPFTPKAGMREIHAETRLRWSVAERWIIFATIQQGRLLNDAANSPLTRSKNQTGFGLGFGYQLVGRN